MILPLVLHERVGFPDVMPNNCHKRVGSQDAKETLEKPDSSRRTFAEFFSSSGLSAKDLHLPLVRFTS
jgi:hypothetical protein